MRLIAKVLTGALAVCASQTASAQTEGPVAGTWGVEGSPGAVSLLRFRSSSSALVIGAEAFMTRMEVPEFDQVTGQLVTEKETFVSTQLRLGIRRYREDRARVRRFSTLSGLVGYSRNTSIVEGWQLGASGDIGAAYFFTPHASLGGLGDLTALYQKGTGAQSRDLFSANFGFRLLGAVYF